MSSVTVSTLAPPAAARSSQSRRPLPAGSRPRPNAVQFPFKELLRLPGRLFYPPTLSAEAAGEQLGSARRTALRDVTLADVLAGKYLSPLSLKDFEGHLVFREVAAEQLYFVLWLKEYEKEWTAWQKSLKHSSDFHLISDLPSDLHASVTAGVEAFLTPNARLELNLSSATRDKTLADVTVTGTPAAFQPAKDVVEESLERSLRAFKKASVSMAGPRRLALCFCMGLALFLLGLVPAIVSIVGHHSRGIRAISIPFIFMGVSLMSMAPRRICFALYCLGQDRQMLPWEIKPVTVTSASIVPLKGLTTLSQDEESSFGDDVWEEDDKSFATAHSTFPHPWEQEKSVSSPTPTHCPTFPPCSPSVGSTAPLGRATRFSSYSAGTDYSSIVGSQGAWDPVCKVYSPEVAQEHWKVVVQGFGIGAVAAAALGAMLLAVPAA